MASYREPPPGGDQNRGPALLAIAVVSSSIAIVTTIIRIIGRTFVLRSVGWDDYTIVIAAAISIVAVCVNGEQVKNGAGRHEYYLDKPEIIEELKWHALSQIQLYICTALIKTSLCLFLIRIVNKKCLTRLLYALIAAMIIVNLAVVIALVTQCRPLEKVWDVRVKGHCWKVEVLKVFAWIAGTFAAVTDFVCSLLPSIFLWKVKINPRRKLAICALMGLGLIATAFSVLKMVLIKHLGASDPTYSQTTIQISAILEENIGIIAVNLPLMRPLYSVLSPRIKSRYARLGDSFKRRLYGNRTNESTEMRSTAQKLGSGDDRDWGLRVPGSQTMKTIDMPLARIDDSRGSESGSISPSERKSNGQVVENWV